MNINDILLIIKRVRLHRHSVTVSEANVVDKTEQILPKSSW